MKKTNAAASGPKSAPLVSPYCQHLTSKKIMLLESPPMVDRDVLDASQHVWCGVTYKVLGPDRKQCSPEDCLKGRDCFESPFSDLL